MPSIDSVQIDEVGSSHVGDSMLIHLNAQTGELLTEKFRTLRGPDGAARTYKTVERLNNGK
jgi:hypothetical protein